MGLSFGTDTNLGGREPWRPHGADDEWVTPARRGWVRGVTEPSVLGVSAPDRSATVVAEPARRAWPPRADLRLAGAALALVAVAGVTVFLLPTDPRAELDTKVAPLLADFAPHVGPGTPLALLLAWAGVVWGPRLALRLSWPRLLGAVYAGTLAWTAALALVDGWSRGFAGRLTTPDEYLTEVPRVPDIGVMLQTFTTMILDFQPGAWKVHVSAHPPGAFLVYLGLDRVGLGGGAWASTLTVLIGVSAPVAVLVGVRALAGSQRLARRAAPFLVLSPAAIWVGVSADGLFAGVVAWGIALLAVAAGGRTTRPVLVAVAAGVLLGAGVYLSYGLVLMAPLAVAVLVAARTWRPLLPAVLGALAVAGVFTALGFWWFEGYELLVQRYYQGIASRRTYGYWVWGNLAALTCVVGLATVPAVRRALAWRRIRERDGLTLLVLGAALAVVAADLSGLSKSETERIWLPFAVWLLAATALLPRRDVRFWLGLQVGVALVLNHLLVTAW